MRCMFIKYSGLLLLVFTLLNPVDVFGAKMTNNDVIKLVKAGMSEDLIVNLIAKSDAAFDTSTNAVIMLSKKGVSQRIISAMITSGNEGTISNPKAKDQSLTPQKEGAMNGLKAGGQSGVQKINPEEVVFFDNGQEKTMAYIIPETRTAARALGFGGVATYTVMRGDHAQLRTTDKTPSFLVSVPKNVQPNSYMTLASFMLRKNESREVLVGGGFMSYSTGIHPDRIMPIIFEKMDDQSRATKDFVVYKVISKNPLAPGEYALLLYTKEVRTAGFFAHGANTCFDFGVD